MGIVTKVEQIDESKDPEIRTIGIITLEDIIEEIVDAGDENEEQDFAIAKGETLRLKEKLVLLFSDESTNKEISDVEQNAICEFLQKQIKAFSSSRIRKPQFFIR